MRKVAHILQRKGSSVVTVSPQLPVINALQLMADKNIGSVMVMEGDAYLGIMTERDYARKVILKGQSSTETFVKDIMSTGLPRITPDNSIDTCMHIMSENNIRYLPVFVNDRVTGIISINDVVTETILSQRETIDQLKSYIQS
ncbi:MAG TPA: CBS domain-containing protein [Lacibacter sp.]|mgnify:CR=1 FL=1|nr:CBS domain-containing protein [Lacibacter sp.]HMO89068.1 CBS domain-containing protein [Lacibacter sp.]HMP86560.1 CBS domain-containing protein [Lacibacter sp.]